MADQEEKKKYNTVAKITEMADEFNVNRSTVARFIKSQGYKPVRRDGNTYYYSAAAHQHVADHFAPTDAPASHSTTHSATPHTSTSRNNALLSELRSQLADCSSTMQLSVQQQKQVLDLVNTCFDAVQTITSDMPAMTSVVRETRSAVNTALRSNATQLSYVRKQIELLDVIAADLKDVKKTVNSFEPRLDRAYKNVRHIDYDTVANRIADVLEQRANTDISTKTANKVVKLPAAR